MSTIGFGLNATYPDALDVSLFAQNRAPGRVVCDFYGPTGLIDSFELGIGQSGFIPSRIISGLSASTSYGFSAILYGKTSGNILATGSSTYTTAAAPPPNFPPNFPPDFPPNFPPNFPPDFPPDFSPFFPPFFPPTFTPSPSWSDQALSTTSVVEGQSYSDGVTATNATSYAVQSGSLPSGITLNTSTGAITGTAAQGSAGTYNFVIRASGAGGSIDTNTLTLTVIDDGGKVRVFNSATSQWIEAPVFVYNSTTSQWVQSDVYVYNSATSSWQKSV